MLVEWRPQARDNLRSILGYIAGRNQNAALALAEDVERATSALPEHPYFTGPAESPERESWLFTRTT